MTDLVKRLRARVDGWKDGMPLHSLLTEAADRIEELDGKLEMAQTNLGLAIKLWDRGVHDLAEAQKRVEELEQHTAPLAADGKSVFIDGRGEVPLCAKK